MPRIVDLSQEIHSEMQIFPAYPKPAFTLWAKRDVHGFQAEAVFLVTHTGTHVDAPFHFDPEGPQVHEVQLEALYADGLLLDLTHKGAKQLITASDLVEAERRAGAESRRGDVILVRTGWERLLGRLEYLTTYPGLSKEAAQYLAEKKVSAVGVDSPNPDHPDDAAFPVHHILLPKGVLIIENLVNLDKLPGPRFKFLGLPLKIRGGTGSPIRAAALID